MNKILKIEQYINDFFSTRFSDYKLFYNGESMNKRIGIYKLKNGSELMDFFTTIICQIEERIYFKNLVPHIFPNPEKLIDHLKNFKDYLNDKQKLLDINKAGNNTSYIIDELQIIKIELVEMIDYILMIYDREDINIPYQELRHSLITKDVNSFVRDMNSILASVSYAISKIHEGYLHSNIHIILRLLGFDILSEETTNIGRIDAVIRFSNIIYIFEFKLGTSEEALNQIKDKKYYEKFIIERKEIILVGIGFDAENRNIKDCKIEIYQ